LESILNKAVGTPPELDPRIFVICYNDGNFHSMTADQDLAWKKARKIGGWIGELTNVHKPQYLEEVVPEEHRQSIIDFVSGRASEMRRGRPVRKTDIDTDQSGPALDPPSAA
jgi:hypothetical protein